MARGACGFVRESCARCRALQCFWSAESSQPLVDDEPSRQLHRLTNERQLVPCAAPSATPSSPSVLSTGCDPVITVPRPPLPSSSAATLSQSPRQPTPPPATRSSGVAARKRLERERQQLQRTPVEGVRLDYWGDAGMLRAVITGPDGTPYAGGKYSVHIDVPADYPFQPPVIVFVTQIFHTHVHPTDGGIDLEVLRIDWSPSLGIGGVLASVRALLGTAGHSPINSEASNMFESSPWQYLEEARRHAQIYADAPSDASWAYFPISSSRSMIEKVEVTNLLTHKTFELRAADETTVAEIQDALMDSFPHPLLIYGRGFLLAEDKSLSYYGLDNNTSLTATLPCSTMTLVTNLLDFVHGPNVPTYAVTISQEACDDGSITATATAMDGRVLLTRHSLTTDMAVPAEMYGAVKAEIQASGRHRGRLQLVTHSGSEFI